MGNKYMKYADALRSIASAARQRYELAEDRLSKAEQARREHPRLIGQSMSDSDIAAAARAEADYTEAVAALNSVHMTTPGEVMRRITELKNKLTAELDRDYGAKSKDVDGAVIALLDSGILTADELSSLADGATPTMRRIIAAYALKQAAEAEDGGDESAARDFRAVGYAAQQSAGADIQEAFNCAAEVITRCVQNHAMFAEFEGLIAPFLAVMENN